MLTTQKVAGVLKKAGFRQYAGGECKAPGFQVLRGSLLGQPRIYVGAVTPEGTPEPVGIENAKKYLATLAPAGIAGLIEADNPRVVVVPAEQS